MSVRRIVIAALAVLVVAALGYTAYWFHVAGQLRKDIEAWAESRRAAGWTVAWDDLTVGGFPRRVRVDIAAPVLIQPDGASWRGPAVTASASPFDLTLIEVLGAGTHHLVWPGLPPATATAQTARLVLDLSRTGVLEDAGLTVTALTVAAEGAGEVSVVTLALGLDPLPVAAPTHQDATLAFSLSIQDVGLPAIQGLVMDRTVSLAEANGRVLGRIPPGPPADAVARWTADGGTVELDRIAVDWAPMGMEGDGTLALDPALQPMAALSARVRGYGELMDRLARAGVVDPGAANAAKILLSLLSKPDSQGRPAIAVPLTLQDGGLWLGPAKVARVPPIQWPAQR